MNTTSFGDIISRQYFNKISAKSDKEKMFGRGLREAKKGDAMIEASNLLSLIHLLEEEKKNVEMLKADRNLLQAHAFYRFVS